MISVLEWSFHAARVVPANIVDRRTAGIPSCYSLDALQGKSRDKEHAVWTPRILRRKKHSLDAVSIRAWAIAHGWRPSAADERAMLAAKTAALKTAPKLDRLNAAETTYANWVDAAE